jgi:hypothetical protein
MKFISLGSDCSPATNTCRYFNKEAYPFDWIWSNIDFIIKTFETDYFEFTEVEKLNFVRSNNAGYIFNNNCEGNSERVCSALSVHDAEKMTNEQFIINIPIINEKYKRRFARLYEILNSNEDIFLIRMALENSQGAVKNIPDDIEKLNLLIKLLKNKFTANITLIVVDKNTDIQYNAKSIHENIKIFKSFTELNKFLLNINHLSPTA